MSAPSGQGGQPPWQNSSSRGKFVYVPSKDLIVTQDGRSYKRPTEVDPNTLRAAQWEGPLPFAYSGSPPTGESYIHSAHRPQLGRQLGNAQAPRHASTMPQIAREIDQVAANTAKMSLNTQNPRSPRLTAEATPGKFYQHKGVTYVDICNEQNQVRTILKTSPPENFTDAALLKRGIKATRMIVGTEGKEEKLFMSFRINARPNTFFSKGRVFLILWAEPAGESNTVVSKLQPGTRPGLYGESVYSKVRRFVVIRAGIGYCTALPITTYGGRGVAKPGAIKSEHAIIFTGKKAPEPTAEERPSSNMEAGMRPRPIRVISDKPTETLDPMSRLDFGKVHTVQHNIKVRSLGLVHEKSLADLEFQFDNVWNKEPSAAGPSTARAPKPRAPTTTLADPKTAKVVKTLMERGYTEKRAIQIIDIKRQQAMDELLAKQGGSGKQRAQSIPDDAEDDEGDSEYVDDDEDEEDEADDSAALENALAASSAVAAQDDDDSDSDSDGGEAGKPE